MKIRRLSHDERVELGMTPMIDIVFQLLVFFILTFNIVVVEGEFNFKMPLAGQGGLPPHDAPLAFVVHLHAGADGRLARVTVNHQSFEGATREQLLSKLNAYVVTNTSSLEPGMADGEPFVELGFDAQLRYEHVVDGLAAVTGYIDPATGRPVRLIEQVRFMRPKEK